MIISLTYFDGNVAINDDQQLLPDDFQKVKAVYELAQISYPHGAPWQENQFILDVQSDQSIYFCVYEHNQLIAFLSFRLMFDQIEIDHVVVHPNWQNKQIAQQLCQRLFEYATKHEVVEIFLEVRQSNYKAYQLYQKAGFEQIAIRKAYYHAPIEDALIMRKTIGKVD